MTMRFGDELHLSNGSATELLRAIGCPKDQMVGTHGVMALDAVAAGITRARATPAGKEAPLREWLDGLAQVVSARLGAGHVDLEWS